MNQTDHVDWRGEALCGTNFITIKRETKSPLGRVGSEAPEFKRKLQQNHHRVSLQCIFLSLKMFFKCTACTNFTGSIEDIDKIQQRLPKSSMTVKFVRWHVFDGLLLKSNVRLSTVRLERYLLLIMPVHVSNTTEHWTLFCLDLRMDGKNSGKIWSVPMCLNPKCKPKHPGSSFWLSLTWPSQPCVTVAEETEDTG